MGSLILRQVTCTSVPSVGEDDLELLSFLLSPPEHRGSRRVPPHLGYARLGADPGASCVLGKQPINSASQLREAPFVSGLPFPRAYFHIIYWFPFLGKLLHIVLGSTPSRTLSSPKLIPFYLFTNFCFLPQRAVDFKDYFDPSLRMSTLSLLFFLEKALKEKDIFCVFYCLFSSLGKWPKLVRSNKSNQKNI